LDTRRLFLAALLSLAVLFGWQVLFPPPKPAPRPAIPAVATPSPATPAATPAPAPAAPVAASAAAPVESLAASAESEVAVEGADLVAHFTNRGAVLTSLRLKSRLEGIGSGGIELIQQRSAGPYPLALVGGKGEPLALNDVLFTVERSSDAKGERLSFRYRGKEGEAEKSLRFLAGGLVEIEATVRGTGPWGMLFGPGLRQLSAEELNSRFARRAGSWLAAGEVHTLAPKDVKERTPIAGADLSWVGLEDTYFLTAFVPRAPLDRAQLVPVLLHPATGGKSFTAEPAPEGDLSAEQKALSRDLRLELYPRGEKLELTSFWGVKQYERLAALPYGLERAVHWGTLGFLSRPLLWGVQWIVQHVVANWGWAIVLATAALKLLLLPLTLTGMASMQKMQRLNPKIQAIRERYRPKLRDKQGRHSGESQRQMNEEVMALYKAEGVNPAGGCLPLLLQIPVFFAFYNLLSTAVELWHAPWLGWIRDLSAADPYYALPILMGATQVLQQRMTPQAADPIQRRMFQLFPVIFTVFSLGFPSGLVLYWLVNNVLTIVQQALYNRWKAANEVPAVALAKSGKRRGGER